MGCGSSSAAGAVRSEPIKVQPSDKNAKLPPNGFGVAPQKKLPPIKSEQKPMTQQSEAATTAAGGEKTGKGGVAFSIDVGGSGEGQQQGAGAAANDIDKILRKPLPPRLRHLEPLDNAPTIRPDQLAEKLRKAEEKRARMLEKRRNSSVTKQSKARRELLKAQEFSGSGGGGGGGELGDGAEGAEAAATAGANPGLESLQQKQAIAEQKRQAKLAAVQEKQRIRAERARAARERAKRLKEEMEMEAELQIEKDEGSGESDSDASWLGEDDAADAKSGGGKKAKASRTPATPLLVGAGEQTPQRDSSGYSSRDASSAGQPSELGSRATTGKTVSTVLEDDRDYDFYD